MHMAVYNLNSGITVLVADFLARFASQVLSNMESAYTWFPSMFIFSIEMLFSGKMISRSMAEFLVICDSVTSQ